MATPSIKTTIANLTAKTAATQKPSVVTGATGNVKQLTKVIGNLLGAPLAEPTSSPAVGGRVEISFINKVIKLEHIKSGTATKTIELKTMNGFLAAIMNLFATIFPCCVQGAAKFKIDDQTVYVRRSLIQATLPNGIIARNDFQNDAIGNRFDLIKSAYTHFKA